MYSVLL